MAWLTLKLPPLFAFASICTVSALFSHIGAAATPAPAPIVPVSSRDHVHSHLQAGLTVDCGFVPEPEDRAVPNGTVIRLAVAIFQISSILQPGHRLIFWEGAWVIRPRRLRSARLRRPGAGSHQRPRSRYVRSARCRILAAVPALSGVGHP